MRRWLRRIALGLLLFLVVLVLAAVALLTTTAGARWLMGRAEALMPSLSLEVVSGDLLTGLVLRDVVWHGAARDVTVERIEGEWTASCLLTARVCVDRLYLQGTRVTATGAEVSEELEQESGGLMSLLAAIRLDDLRLRDTEITLAEGQRVALRRLAGSIVIEGPQVTLTGVALQGLTIRLPAASEAAAPAPPAASPLLAPIALPVVRPPMDATVQGLTLQDARLIQGDTVQVLDSLQLTAALEGPQLRLQRLALSSPRGELSASGRIRLAGGYPLSLDVKARATELIEGRPVAVDLQLDGSVADLEVAADVSGAVSARLTAELQPLKPPRPFEVTLEADSLAWPLTGEPTVRAEGVRVEATGDLEGYRLTARAALDGPEVPSGDWSLQAVGDLESLRIESLTGQTLDGVIRADGRVAWGGAPSWQIGIALEGINPGVYRPDLPGHLSGRLTTSGKVTDDGPMLSVEVPGIEGELRGYPLRLTGAVRLAADGTWSFQDIRLASGPNRLRVQGSLGEQWDAVVRLKAPELAALWPGLSGALSGSVNVSGEPAAPTVALDLAGEGVGYQDIVTRRLRVEGRIANAFRAASRLTVEVAGLRSGERPVGDIAVVLAGTLADHRLELDVSGGPIGTELVVTGALEPETTAWQGRLETASVALPAGRWSLAEPTAIEWRPQPAVAWIAPFCWQRDGASLCAPQPVVAGAGRADAELSLSGYRLGWLDPWLPEGIAWQGPLAGSAAIRWQGEALPRVQVSIHSEQGEVRVAATEGSSGKPLGLAYRRLALGLTLENEQATVRLMLESEALGDAEAEIRVDPGETPRPIAGTVNLEGLKLAPLQPFLPALDELAGELRVRGELAGTLSEPRFDGEIALTGGRVGARQTPTTIEDIRLTASISGTRAELDGGFRSGDGTAQIGGEVRWGDGIHANVSLVGESLDVAYPPLVRVDVSPDLTFTVDPGVVLIDGRVVIPSGTITLEELPAGTVPISEDVVIVNRPPEQEGEDGEEAGGGGGWTIRSSVYLVLGDDVHFQGFGATGRLTGELELQQVGAGGLVANGEISLVEGEYKAYGQELEIRTGQLIFAGPITSPQIRIEAVRHVGAVTAGIRVTGDAKQPDVELFSEPPMPQEDILAYLLTGRPPGAEGPSKEMLAARAALSLGVLGGRGTAAAVAEELGVEDFALETTDEGQVAVSGYISPNLLVRYGVGVFTPGNTLTLRYYLTEQLYLEAVSGLESALDIFYSFDF